LKNWKKESQTWRQGITIKHRLQKLEKEIVGRGKIYTFRMSDGMDTSAIKEEFCKEKGIEPKANDMFIFARIFSFEKPFWEFLHESDIRS